MSSTMNNTVDSVQKEVIIFGGEVSWFVIVIVVDVMMSMGCVVIVSTICVVARSVEHVVVKDVLCFGKSVDNICDGLQQKVIIFSIHSFSISLLFSEYIVHQAGCSMGSSVDNIVDSVEKEL